PNVLVFFHFNFSLFTYNMILNVNSFLMFKGPKSRYFIATSIFLLYLLPLSFLIYKAIHGLPKQDSWEILSLGMIFCSFGSFVFFWLMTNWEHSLSTSLQSEIINNMEIVPEIREVIVEKQVENEPLKKELEESLQIISELKNSLDNKEN